MMDHDGTWTLQWHWCCQNSGSHSELLFMRGGVFGRVPNLIIFSLVGCLVMIGLIFKSVSWWRALLAVSLLVWSDV